MDEATQDDLLAALEQDLTRAVIDDTDRTILDYAGKLTTTPREMNAGDVQGLRDVGLDDRAIHDVCAITAYFNFVNRMADGLGVELEGETDQTGPTR